MDNGDEELSTARAMPTDALTAHWRCRGTYVEDLAQFEAVPRELLPIGRWARVLAGAWRLPEAIHMKECRAALLGLRRAVRSRTCWGSLVCSLGDNLSEVLACERGRARNHELNAICRVSSSFQIATGIKWIRRHVRSEDNATDWDSRLADRHIIAAGECLGARALVRRLAMRGVDDPVGLEQKTFRGDKQTPPPPPPVRVEPPPAAARLR